MARLLENSTFQVSRELDLMVDEFANFFYFGKGNFGFFFINQFSSG